MTRLTASSALLSFLLIASPASAVTMAWTPIGNPGNACELQGQGCFGAVSYAYYIGTYEVTNAQYAEFLNAKAASDPFDLYHPAMGNLELFGGIARSGGSGSFTYSAVAGRENMPVNLVTFYDALRFANWMNNGQGNGDTETGAYTLLGGTATPTNGLTVTRNAGATIAMPTENEWYKAAYYDAATANHFNYAAGTDTQTICSIPTTTANTANCHGVVADLAPIGSYTVSTSPYGTFDQGGNVLEWNESFVASPISGRGIRGGGLDSSPLLLEASKRSSAAEAAEFKEVGFRVAMVPEPSRERLMISGVLGVLGLAAGCGSHRRATLRRSPT